MPTPVKITPRGTERKEKWRLRQNAEKGPRVASPEAAEARPSNATANLQHFASTDVVVPHDVPSQVALVSRGIGVSSTGDRDITGQQRFAVVRSDFGRCNNNRQLRNTAFAPDAHCRIPNTRTKKLAHT